MFKKHYLIYIFIYLLLSDEFVIKIDENSLLFAFLWLHRRRNLKICNEIDEILCISIL